MFGFAFWTVSSRNQPIPWCVPMSRRVLQETVSRFVFQVTVYFAASKMSLLFGQFVQIMCIDNSKDYEPTSVIIKERIIFIHGVTHSLIKILDLNKNSGNYYKNI